MIWVSTSGDEDHFLAVGLITADDTLTDDPALAYRWNGFVNPVFDARVTAQVCAAFTRDGDGDYFRLLDDGRVLIDETAHYPDEPDGASVTYCPPRDDGLYGCFTFGYTWQPTFPPPALETTRMAKPKSANHALFIGATFGLMMKAGIDCEPQIDEDGDYQDTIVLNINGIPGNMRLAVVVPEPPADWRL